MFAALAKLERFSGVAIEGHPDVTFDGVFKLHSTHEGWPVLRSDQDKCESSNGFARRGCTSLGLTETRPFLCSQLIE